MTSYDEMVSLGREIMERETDASFALGDLANQVHVLRANDPLLDKKAKTLKTFAADIGAPYGTLKEAARTARAIEPGVRGSFPMLTYSHWRIIARKKKGTDVIEYAKAAHDENWSVERLAHRLCDTGNGEATLSPRRWLSRCAKSAGDVDFGHESLVEALRNDPDGVRLDLAILEGALSDLRDVCARVLAA